MSDSLIAEILVAMPGSVVFLRMSEPLDSDRAQAFKIEAVDYLEGSDVKLILLGPEVTFARPYEETDAQRD